MFFYLIFLVAMFFHGYASGAEYAIIEDGSQLSILTPSFSETQTLKLQLENGLQAYLISDPQVEKASAALAVNVGSWSDPKDCPGVAHFLEHMLFLGTKKYPIESEYDRFISENGGQSNAFTSNDATAYVFSIDHKAFLEAFDRFASFFNEPLLNPSGVARELQAIDQEYAKNVENDDIREYYVHKELCNPEHPNHGFSMGNRNSLLKVSQETLKSWYLSHYSADKMRLEVVSNLPLEQLTQLVVDKFKFVPKIDIPPLHLDMPLIGIQVKGHMVYIEPVMDMRQLTLIWELPRQFAEMRETKPEFLVSHILGHEGEKSLLAALKKEKLANSIICGSERIGGKQMELFLRIGLTDAGVKNVDEVILKCFQALANLRKKGIPAYIFDELRTMSLIDYQYQPREDSFEHILKEAGLLSQESMETYPAQTRTFQKHDPTAIHELLNELTPKNCVFDLLAPQRLTGIELDAVEHWLEVPYAIKEIPLKTMKRWEEALPNPQIDLPEPNPFIPQKLALVHSNPSVGNHEAWTVPQPALLVSHDHGKIYFAEDARYAIPKISWIFEIKTPSIALTRPESIVMGDLYVKTILEMLSGYTYPASLAGLQFDIACTGQGLAVSIHGYSEKAEVLFQDIIEDLTHPELNEQKFKVFKEALLRQYQNASADKPFMQAYEVLRSIIYKDFVTDKAKAAAIKNVTLEQYQAFMAHLFSKSYVEGMLYGNMTKEDASRMLSHLFTTLNSEPYPSEEQPKKEIIVLPDDRGPFFVEAKTKSQGNAVFLTLEDLPFSFNARAAQQILMQGIKQPFFSTLRTKQQTGYIVKSQAEELENHLFDTFAVQSNTHEGRDLLARFELFIESFLQEIDTEISEERFHTIKTSLLQILQQAPKSQSEMAELLYALAFTYQGDFLRLEKRIQGFETLTYPDFLDYVHRVLGKNNKRRIAVLLMGSCPEERVLQYKRACGVGQVRKLATYEGKQN